MAGKVSMTFLGAAETVTGSRYLLENSEHRVLVDCGIFQGYKHLRQRNWQAFPVAADSIDAVFLTHAHLDHSGYLPRLVAEGFRGPVFCTPQTAQLCEILLPDSAHLQEEEARFRNRHHYSRHDPALPLYTARDVQRALELLNPVPFANGERDSGAKLGDINVNFHRNGHILGSAFLDLQISGRHVLFSGDVGRPEDLLMHAPDAPVHCDYLVVESTYGNRLHDDRDLWTTVADVINRTAARGGSVLIPAFAVGRAQLMLHLLLELRRRGDIHHLPIYLDSPMAIRATEIMLREPAAHRLTPAQCRRIRDDIVFTSTVEESQGINSVNLPCIILSASGMATGGRVLHHLQRMIGDDRNSILFAGYQAGGTRGARLVDGVRDIKIFGQTMEVRAEVDGMDFLSAHADHRELVDWLRQMPAPPKHTWVTHGEPDAADQFRQHLEDQLNWRATVPSLGQVVEL